MPQTDSLNDYPLSTHVEAVIVSLHYLKLKLRAELKTSSKPDKNIPEILRLLLKEIETSKAEIGDDLTRLEQRYEDLRQSDMP